jgi:hypothetical protein
MQELVVLIYIVSLFVVQMILAICGFIDRQRAASDTLFIVSIYVFLKILQYNL